MDDKIELRLAQLRLMIVWLIGVTPSVSLLIIRTLSPDSLNIEKVWGWLLTSIMPTLSLVIGTYAAAAQQSQVGKIADRTFYKITIGLSIGYLIILNIAVFWYPLKHEDALKLLDTMSLVLGPLQGLVSASLGVFFIHQTTRGNPNQANAGV
jgi:hypothetical protein